MPSDKWNFPKPLLREDTKLKGKSREENRRVHVGEVIACEDSDPVCLKTLSTDDANGRKRDPQQSTSPNLRDAVLDASGDIP